ncbi:MAG: hypothetical protein HUU29_04195 [Planctomycetaceae bacterium]|nr:hypothetical protein [Planctomycetaceae bacterium]
MRLGVSYIKRLYPGREKTYFGLTIAVAIYFALATQYTAPDFNVVRDRAIKDMAGKYDAGGISTFLSQAMAVPEANDSAESDAIRQKLDERLPAPDLAKLVAARDLFARDGEAVFPMPPLSLDAPAIPDVPGFDVTVGDAPSLELQNRAAPRDKRPVDLVRDEGKNPYDFRDREGR